MYMAGLGFLTLAKAKNILRGYSSPKPFELAETDRCVAYDLKVVDEWLLHLAAYTGSATCFAGNPPLNLLNQFCNLPPPGQDKPSVGTFAQCLAQHGYTQWTSYQPASRFWPFQWIEGGWLLALSVLLIAATVWLVQRRAA